MRILILFVLVVLGGVGCTARTPKRAEVANCYDCACEKRAVNGVGNMGLWEGKPSLKDVFTSAEWNEFQAIVKNTKFDQSCKNLILKEAAELPEGKPVLLNMLIIATQVFPKK